MRFLLKIRVHSLKIIVIYISLIIESIMISAFAATDTRIVRLGRHKFEIPQNYFRDQGPFWLRWIPGLDDGSRSLLLIISASEVAAMIPGFKPKDGNYDDNLRIILTVRHEYERRRYLDSNYFADIWNSAESYDDKVIETDPETHFIRVYRRIEYPNSWQGFTISLDKPMPFDISSFWLGHCGRSASPLAPSGHLMLCKSYIVTDDIAVDYTMSNQNLIYTKEIRNYLTSLVSQWLKK